jgi:hypothetical protein
MFRPIQAPRVHHVLGGITTVWLVVARAQQPAVSVFGYFAGTSGRSFGKWPDLVKVLEDWEVAN